MHKFSKRVQKFFNNMKENITMSSNRSQISILIILALIVIISIIAVFMFSTEKSSKDQNDDENVGEDFF